MLWETQTNGILMRHLSHRTLLKTKTSFFNLAQFRFLASELMLNYILQNALNVCDCLDDDYGM